CGGHLARGNGAPGAGRRTRPHPRAGRALRPRRHRGGRRRRRGRRVGARRIPLLRLHDGGRGPAAPGRHAPRRSEARAHPARARRMIDVATWWRAVRVIPRVTPSEWARLDLVSRWLIATRSVVLVMTFVSSTIAGLLAARDGSFALVPWLALTVG